MEIVEIVEKTLKDANTLGDTRYAISFLGSSDIETLIKWGEDTASAVKRDIFDDPPVLTEGQELRHFLLLSEPVIGLALKVAGLNAEFRGDSDQVKILGKMWFKLHLKDNPETFKDFMDGVRRARQNLNTKKKQSLSLNTNTMGKPCSALRVDRVPPSPQPPNTKKTGCGCAVLFIIGFLLLCQLIYSITRG